MALSNGFSAARLAEKQCRSICFSRRRGPAENESISRPDSAHKSVCSVQLSTSGQASEETGGGRQVFHLVTAERCREQRVFALAGCIGLPSCPSILGRSSFPTYLSRMMLTKRSYIAANQRFYWMQARRVASLQSSSIFSIAHGDSIVFRVTLSL